MSNYNINYTDGLRVTGCRTNITTSTTINQSFVNKSADFYKPSVKPHPVGNDVIYIDSNAYSLTSPSSKDFGYNNNGTLGCQDCGILRSPHSFAYKGRRICGTCLINNQQKSRKFKKCGTCNLHIYNSSDRNCLRCQQYNIQLDKFIYNLPASTVLTVNPHM